MKKLRLLLLCVMMTIVTLVQSVPAMADTGGSAAAGTLNIPKAVTIQVGETVTIDITGKPAVSTYVYNASYQKQMDYYDMDVKSFGTYWGKPGKVVLKGKNPGESELIITLRMFKKIKLKLISALLQDAVRLRSLQKKVPVVKPQKRTFPSRISP